MKRLLVATDGSRSADRAVKFAAELAQETASELIIVTVLQWLTSDDLERFSKIERATLGDMLENEAKTLLTRARAAAEKSGAVNVKTKTEDGEATQAILDVAKTSKCEAIVVGKRGRSRLKGLLLGSISQKLVTLADCPVIVVP